MPLGEGLGLPPENPPAQPQPSKSPTPAKGRAKVPPLDLKGIRTSSDKSQRQRPEAKREELADKTDGAVKDAHAPRALTPENRIRPRVERLKLDTAEGTPAETTNTVSARLLSPKKAEASGKNAEPSTRGPLLQRQNARLSLRPQSVPIEKNPPPAVAPKVRSSSAPGKVGLGGLNLGGPKAAESDTDPRVGSALEKLSQEHANLPKDKQIPKNKKNYERNISYTNANNDLTVRANLEGKNRIGQGGFKEIYRGEVTTKSGQSAPVAVAVSTFHKFIQSGIDPADIAKHITVGTKEMEVSDPNKFPQSLPNVVYPISVALTDQGEKTQLTIVMPLMAGGGADKLNKLDNPEAPAIRLSTTKQFIRAIHGLQSNGIYQRDINPSNAMFEQVPISAASVDGKLKLIDMGTHDRIGQNENLTLPQALEILNVRITPHYTSPELAALRDYLNEDGTIGRADADYTNNPGVLKAREMLYTNGKIDPGKVRQFVINSEIYSTCISAYEILMGELPPHLKSIIENSHGPTPEYTNIKIIHDVSKLTSTIVPKEIPAEILARAREKGVPEDLIRSIWSGLNVDPGARPPLSKLLT